MAYRRRIIDRCYYLGCEKEARWEVFNYQNSSLVKFCRDHAGQRERAQQASETKVLLGMR